MFWDGLVIIGAKEGSNVLIKLVPEDSGLSLPATMMSGGGRGQMDDKLRSPSSL